MQYNTIQIQEGVKLHKINTSKFKTNLISVILTTKLNREDITKKALILAILKRGTNNLKSQEDINIKLEELYGAELNCGVDKIGNDHIMKFYIETLNDNFTYKKENLLQESVKLLFDIIFNPLIENGKFKEEYIKSEKQKLKQIIDAKKDNKAHYSYTRCIEEMYKNDPYGLYSFGYSEDIEKITDKDLYETYLELIKQCKIDIFVSGNFEENEEKAIDTLILEMLQNHKIAPRNVEQIYLKNEEKEEKTETVVKEKMDVSQGKLVIGLDIINSRLEDRPIITVYNSILGGGANSKLFQNVREKASLAYSASSMYLKNKNNIIIRSGIEPKNFDKALNIIKQQIEDIKLGNFTSKDIQDAKELIISSFKSMQDEQDSEISYYIGRELEQSDTDVEKYINEVANVSKEQIVQIANNIKTNTIYFLTNNN
ncbi:MAG: EF-P 5-aminopentanol modification-associated protein YfmF [Clostridia bacterium]